MSERVYVRLIPDGGIEVTCNKKRAARWAEAQREIDPSIDIETWVIPVARPAAWGGSIWSYLFLEEQKEQA